MSVTVDSPVLLLLLTTALRVATAGPEYHQQKFLCPKLSASTDGDNGKQLLRTVTAASVLHCANSCRRTDRCDGFSFAEKNPGAPGTCYLGDEDIDYDQLWSPGKCKTYLKSPDLDKLQMKLMYNFKVGGLSNLADPNGFGKLTAFNVSIGSRGAEFKGHLGSYLRAETPGIEQLLDYGKEFSFFVQVQHVMNSSVQPVYYEFQRCSSDSSFGSAFGKSSSNEFLVLNSFVSGPDHQRIAFSPSIAQDDGQRHVFTTGYVFNATQVDSFYYNGSLVPPRFSLNLGRNQSASDGFQCLLLGNWPSVDSGSLDGAMRCFGLSGKALSLSEFKRLEGYCLQ